MDGARNGTRSRVAGGLREVTGGAWPAGPLPVHDARRFPDGAVLDYDVCIVGTGAAGATAALALAGRGLRIAVLEGGGVVPDDVTTAFTSVESTGHHVDRASRERWLGGTTNTWTGGKTTLDDIDLRQRPWVADSGWPLDPAHLWRCYERAATLLDRPGPATYDGPGPAPDDGFRFDGDGLRTLVFHEDAHPLRFGQLLRSRLRPGDGVDLVTLANVTEVHLDDRGERVDGVDAATLNGRRFRMRAPVVVLACGAIENARLLLASRSRRPAGLGNGHDVVGRYFQDHPKGFTAEIAVDPAARRLPASRYWPGKFDRTGRVRWGVGLDEAAQQAAGVLNSYVRLEPVVLDSVPEGVATLRRAARGRVRGLDPRPLAALPAEAPALARMIGFRTRNEGPIDRILVRSFLEQEPRRACRVRLSDRRDPLGLPLAAVDWDLSDLDRRSVRAVHDALASAVRRHGLGEMHADLDDGSEVWATLSDASHHAGTTRMGRDPATSVTGPDGQVHEVPGLFLAGASLFPTSGYANPVFTIAAIAVHVADQVAARLSPPPAAVSTAEGRSAPLSLARPEPTPAGVAEARRWLSARRRARRLSPAASRATALTWPAPGRAEVVPVEVPEPGHGQVSVLVDASAVSLGTERARWLRLPGAAVAYPHQPGYSLAGVVRGVGPGVHDIESGTPVAVWGAPHQSLVTVHRAQVHVLAPGTDLAHASLVTLGAIAELGVARAGEVAGRSLAVTGAGAIGLLAQRIAAASGAGPCTVVAASSAKDEVVRGDAAARPCPPAAVDDIGAAVVIEATGAAAGLELALRAAAPGATVVLLGTTRAESVAFPLDIVDERGLRVVGAHAGLLDAEGGTDGLDRRGAAQRFLDRMAAGTVRVDDLVTERVDPLAAGVLHDRLAHDRTAVVPVIEWWRLASELRARPGGLALPNPFRRGLTAPTPATAERVEPADVVDHPPAPPVPVPPRRAVGGDDDRDRAAAVADAAARAGQPVAVAGSGALAELVRQAVAERGIAADGTVAADGAVPGVVVLVDPASDTVAAALARLGPSGTLVVAGRVGPVDLDVQTEVHRRGTTVAGVGPAGRAGPGPVESDRVAGRWHDG
ncbi:MAG TPA: GMC oxidoreductase [Acidimicrobiales bacterium]|nr:GMC oxidoreductase [Acidimicrobiales bacterium]